MNFYEPEIMRDLKNCAKAAHLLPHYSTVTSNSQQRWQPRMLLDICMHARASSASGGLGSKSFNLYIHFCNVKYTS